MATTIAVQDFSQLKKDYGAEQAEVITGIVGNVISGQVTGDTAKNLSDSFGKIVQDKNSMAINSSDTTITKATHLDSAIPASKITALSSGEFVGMVADNPDEKIRLKMFHAAIQNDHSAIKVEEEAYKPLPVIERVTEQDIIESYKKIKQEVEELLGTELALLSVKQVLKDAEGQPAQPDTEIQPEQEVPGMQQNDEQEASDQTMSM